MKTYPQFSLVSPRAPMEFRTGTHGRAIKAHPGQTFWAWTTEATQAREGRVQFARSGKPGPSGWLFSLEDAAKYFAPVEDAAPATNEAARVEFRDALAAAYAELFASDPAYTIAAANTTPDALADKVTAALATGTANIEGAAIRKVCKQFGIDCTYKALAAYFAAPAACI